MDDEARQLRQLIGFANLETLRMLENKLSLRCLPQTRSIHSLRECVASQIVNTQTAHKALVVFGVKAEMEFIPRIEWDIPGLVGARECVLHHRHFIEGQNQIQRFLSSGHREACIILPCHRVKPYSLSPTVQAVKKHLERNGLMTRVQLVVASVPGIVPIGMDSCYPFAYYDWDPREESVDIIRAYFEALKARGAAFLKYSRRLFSCFYLYFRPGSVEIDALVGSAQISNVPIEVLPTVGCVTNLKSHDRASWRFRGLKNQVCLYELSQALASALRR
jgi:hypothetical protein